LLPLIEQACKGIIVVLSLWLHQLWLEAAQIGLEALTSRLHRRWCVEHHSVEEARSAWNRLMLRCRSLLDVDILLWGRLELRDYLSGWCEGLGFL